jgi:hypothetical protein
VFFWDITQRRVVILYRLSGQPICSIFKGHEVQEENKANVAGNWKTKGLIATSILVNVKLFMSMNAPLCTRKLEAFHTLRFISIFNKHISTKCWKIPSN